MYRNFRYITIGYLPALLWTAVVFVLLMGNWSSPHSIPVIPHLDKIIHAFLFFILAVTYLWFSILYKRNPSNRTKLHHRQAVGYAVGVGLLTEVVQEYLLSYRNGDIWDFMADVAGVCLALFILRYLKQFAKYIGVV